MIDEAKLRKSIVDSGKAAIDELIIVANESITDEDSLAADRMKNVAASKKTAVFDALDILEKMEEEEKKVAELNGVEEDDLIEITDRSMKIRQRIIVAARNSVEELTHIGKRKIVIPTTTDDEGKIIDKSIAADKMKTAAASKKVAIFDALEILDRIQEEEASIEEHNIENKRNLNNFAERRAT